MDTRPDTGRAVVLELGQAAWRYWWTGPSTRLRRAPWSLDSRLFARGWPHPGRVPPSERSTTHVATIHGTDSGLSSTSESTEYGNIRNPTQISSVRHGWLGAKQRASDVPAGIVLMGVRLSPMRSLPATPMRTRIVTPTRSTVPTSTANGALRSLEEVRFRDIGHLRYPRLVPGPDVVFGPQCLSARGGDIAQGRNSIQGDRGYRERRRHSPPRQ